MNKIELRKKYLIIRQNIINKDKKSEMIFNKLISSDEYKKSNIIALYYSLKSEVNTLELIKYSLKNNKIVLLPKVINNDMVFYKIESLNNLIKSNFGIMEPSNGIIFDKNNIDLIVVPGVCFDKYLNRIGFGKGYYDKYLSNSNIYSIGICFQEQISDGMIITDKTDIKLKKIITDKNIYS